MPDLLCPRCPHRVPILDSDDDPFDDMYLHIEAEHPTVNALSELSHCMEVPDADL